MPDNKLKLKEDLPFGSRICQFSKDGFECDRPATRHFLWLNINKTSNACDEHTAYIRNKDTRETPYDEHTFGDDCDMPGAIWQFPYEEGEESYCIFPAPDDASLLMEEELIAS